jgi:hypothetical protein
MTHNLYRETIQLQANHSLYIIIFCLQSHKRHQGTGAYSSPAPPAATGTLRPQDRHLSSHAQLLHHNAAQRANLRIGEEERSVRR